MTPYLLNTTLGKQNNPGDRNLHKGQNTVERLVKAYKRESQRQKGLIQKAKVCEAKLLFIVSAVSKLLHDERFRALLRAESLDTMPRYLSSKLDLKPAEAS